MRVGLDTNILIYAARPQEARKYAIALRIIERASLPGRGILTLQALTEFYAAATRKAHSTPTQATAYVHAWSTSMPVVPATASDFDTAMLTHRDHNIAFWDALMIATYQSAGASVLFSEDMQDGRVIGTLRIVNPFAENVGPVESLVGLHEDPAAWRQG